MHRKKARLAIKLFAAIAVVAALGTHFILRAVHDRQYPVALRGFAVDPTPISRVSLLDKNGTTLDDRYFTGKWTLVFFGYTNCPDVCPSTLMQMTQLYKSIAQLPDHKDYQFRFISVDPARDTTQRLKSYVEYFNKDFNAASGQIDQITRFEKVFGAFHHYDKKNQDDTQYAVAHSAEVFIVGPRQRFVGKFLPPINVGKLTLKLSQLNSYISHGGSNA